MKYSIIIGTYNQPDTLPKLLASLAVQTFTDFEVHICDDGGDYDIAPLVKDFPLPVYIHRQEQKGMRLAKNLNQGIKAAKGEYCVFIMGDSYASPDWLDELDSYAYGKAIISSFRTNVDKQGKIVSYDWRFGNTPPEELEEIEHASPTTPWASMTGNGMLIPTKLLRETNGWCEEYEGYGKDDWDIVMQGHKKGYKCFTITSAHIYNLDHPNQPDNPKSTEIFLRRLNGS